VGGQVAGQRGSKDGAYAAVGEDLRYFEGATLRARDMLEPDRDALGENVILKDTVLRRETLP